MGAPEIGRDAALWRPIDEPEAEQERLVDVLDRVGLLGQHGSQRRDPDRTRCELLDDRGEQLPIGRVEPFVVDLHLAHRVTRRVFVDTAVAVDLGVVADALEQSIHDPRRAATASGDGARGGAIDRDIEDLGRALDDLDELILGVEVEPVGRAEPVTQRRADAARPGRGADHRERLEAQSQATRGGALADHHIERVVLHGGIEDLLDGTVESVDLVDEQDVALVERGQDRGQVAGSLDRRTGRVADADTEFTRDDRRQGRLAETGRPVEQDVVGRLSPAPGGLEQHRQVGLDLLLTDVLTERARPKRALDDAIGLVLEIAGQDVRDVVDHRARS